MIALDELGGDGRAVVLRVWVGVGGRGGQLPGKEFKGCSWVVCLFEVWHLFAYNGGSFVLVGCAQIEY